MIHIIIIGVVLAFQMYLFKKYLDSVSVYRYQIELQILIESSVIF